MKLMYNKYVPIHQL